MQQISGNRFGQFLFLCCKEPIFFPQDKTALLILTEKATLTFRDNTTTPGTTAYDLKPRGEQGISAGNGGISLDQLLDHGHDTVHKGVGGHFSTLDFGQSILPFCGEQGRLKLIGKHRNQRHARFRGEKMRLLFGLPPLCKAGRYQLFQNTGTGCRCSKTFPFRIFGHILGTGCFHGESSVSSV